MLDDIKQSSIYLIAILTIVWVFSLVGARDHVDPTINDIKTSLLPIPAKHRTIEEIINTPIKGGETSAWDNEFKSAIIPIKDSK
jgi:hypothetical protein